MPIDPIAQKMLDDAKKSGRPNAHLLPVETARHNFEDTFGALARPPVHRVVDITIPIRDGQTIPGRLYLPAEESAQFLGEAPLIRHDLQTGEKVTRDFGTHALLGEFVFVPRSSGAPEGDGWVMGYVIDRASGTTDLAILDATTLADVARVHVPHVIPPGFHGNWLPAV